MAKIFCHTTQGFCCETIGICCTTAIVCRKSSCILLRRLLSHIKVKIKAMLGMLGGGENICGWLFINITLAVSLHKKMTEAGTQAEPVVILRPCLFFFVAGEYEI